MKLLPVTLAASALVGNLWFGTEESYFAYLDALEQVQQLEAAGPEVLKNAIQMRGGGRSDDPFGLPPMWEAQGDTAVVSVQGSLVNGSSGFFRLFGILGYDDIKAAVSEALEDKNVKRIVLDIDSPGGAVNGLEDTGAFIRKASAIKPVTSFTGGSMASAAYWLGISGQHVFAGKTAQVGSVGTLIVHMEMTEALKQSGRKATLFRHGKFKALGHPFEPLSEEASKQIQAMADEAGRIFVEYAAQRRGTTPEKFQKTMGEGRVLMGRQALEVGLIDGVMSFEELVTHAKTLDNKKTTAENPRHSAQGPEMKIRAISKAVILALAGGTKVEALGLSCETANVEGVKPEAEDVVALTAEATEIQSAFAAATTNAVCAAVATAKVDSDKVVTALTAEKTQLVAKVTLLEAGATELTGKVDAANQIAASYAGIVKQSITVMSVALGVADTGATLTGEALTAEHDRLKDLFVKKFPSGGVAAVGTTGNTKVTEGSMPSPEFLAATAGWKK